MKHFVYKTLGELQRAAEALGATHVRFEEDPARVRETLARRPNAGGFTIGNSIAIHPMEGCDGTLEGAPDTLTFRRYARFARGGAKLIWFEATAVCPEGRANPRQLWIHKDNVADFARLLDMARREHRERWGTADDLLEPLQLTHSGRYSAPKRIIACHNPVVDLTTGTPADYPLIDDGELERLEDRYTDAAGLALAAGFRSVDIKATHGYLLSELLGAKTREGRYGGSLENRTRFIGNVAGKIRARFGKQLILAMRLGVYDGVPYGRAYPVPYPYGFGVDCADPLREDLREVKQALRLFREWGFELFNLSLGVPYFNPHLGRPFEKPDEGNYEQPEHPLEGVNRHFRVAGELQRAFPDLPMTSAGYSWLQKYSVNAGAHNIAAGAITLFGLGRGSLAYPDFARDALEKGELSEAKVCKTLSFCTYLMRRKDHPLGQFPTGCPPFDKEVYGPLIKQARGARRG